MTATRSSTSTDGAGPALVRPSPSEPQRAAEQQRRRGGDSEHDKPDDERTHGRVRWTGRPHRWIVGRRRRPGAEQRSRLRNIAAPELRIRVSLERRQDRRQASVRFHVRRDDEPLTFGYQIAAIADRLALLERDNDPARRAAIEPALDVEDAPGRQLLADRADDDHLARSQGPDRRLLEGRRASSRAGRLHYDRGKREERCQAAGVAKPHDPQDATPDRHFRMIRTGSLAPGAWRSRLLARRVPRDSADALTCDNTVT